MKTYEFDIQGSADMIHMIITHDDAGECTGVEFVGDGMEYEIAFVAMGGVASEAAMLHRAISETPSEKVPIATGVTRAQYKLSQEARVALALTLTQNRRANAIILTTSQNTSGYGLRFSGPNLRILIMSIEDRSEIKRVLQSSASGVSFELFLDAYLKLDWVNQKLVMDSMSVYQYEPKDILELARLSNGHVRMTIVHRWLWGSSTAGVASEDLVTAVIDMSISIAKMTEEERIRVMIVEDILVHARQRLSSDQAYAIGDLLLGMSSATIRNHWWNITRFRQVFKDEDQWQQLREMGEAP